MGHEFVDGYLLSLILTALVASHKRRSVFGWLILAFFFSWIAFIVVLILPSKYRCRC